MRHTRGGHCETHAGATARPYALATLCSALALWTAMRAIDEAPAPGAAVSVALSHLLGLFTHPVFAFVTAGSAIAGLGTRRRRLLVGAPLAALAIYAVAWWPMLRQTAALPARTWMSAPGLQEVMRGLLFWGDHATPILLVVVLVLVMVRGRSRLDDARRGVRFAVVSTAVALVGTLVVSRVTPVFLAERTPTFVLPAAALIVAFVIAELGPALVPAAAALLVAASAGRYAVQSARRPDPYPTGSSLAAVAARATCGDTIVAAGLSYAPILYFRQKALVAPCVELVAFPPDVSEHPGWLDASPAAQASLAHRGTDEAARLTGPTVWVFTQVRGVGARESAALVDALAARRTVRATLPLEGSFFSEIRVFGPEIARSTRP